MPINRREFLQSSTLAAAAAFSVHVHAADQPAQSPSELVNCGVMGLGRGLVHAQRIVDHLTFGTCFQATYSPAQGSAHSEKATMIAQALRDFSCAAHDAVMIGDRRFDIEGAHANHVRAIGVSWGFGSIAELRAAQADVIADEPAQLPALLAP